MSLSLHLLPIEMIYRILDHLDMFNILMSCRNVCQRFNNIIDTYHQYQVILHSFLHIFLPSIS